MPIYPQVEFYGEVRHESDLAYLVFDGATEVWLPKSHVIDYRQVDARRRGYEFIIPAWLAKEKGII